MPLIFPELKAGLRTLLISRHLVPATRTVPVVLVPLRGGEEGRRRITTSEADEVLAEERVVRLLDDGDSVGEVVKVRDGHRADDLRVPDHNHGLEEVEDSSVAVALQLPVAGHEDVGDGPLPQHKVQRRADGRPGADGGGAATREVAELPPRVQRHQRARQQQRRQHRHQICK